MKQSLVILLHGVGSNGNDLAPLGKVWRQSLPETGFTAPNAPMPFAMGPPVINGSVINDVTQENRRNGIGGQGCLRRAYCPADGGAGYDRSSRTGGAGGILPGIDNGSGRRCLRTLAVRRGGGFFRPAVVAVAPAAGHRYAGTLDSWRGGSGYPCLGNRARREDPCKIWA